MNELKTEEGAILSIKEDLDNPLIIRIRVDEGGNYPIADAYLTREELSKFVEMLKLWL